MWRGEQDDFGIGCMEGFVSEGHPGRKAEIRKEAGTGNPAGECLVHLRWLEYIVNKGDRPVRKFRAGGK